MYYFCLFGITDPILTLNGREFDDVEGTANVNVGYELSWPISVGPNKSKVVGMCFFSTRIPEKCWLHISVKDLNTERSLL